ncbi:hypothetical protein LTR37_020481 [Vermiconidia calcicola]|uniref:Uncharacterized protein n=1 Tax=Vermiconidia calcicola TaxID=1690605 RepID=A0ACC3MBB9_9PEZI|nr:hypothetical protein LTR37_020481 [Vermiconidia calcicola]
MVKERNTASEGSASARKRSRETASPAPSPSKRRLDADTEAMDVFSREGSPSKSVHFGRNLIQGPTTSRPGQRSQSPTRPALNTRGSSSDDDDAAAFSPSDQLNVEHEAVLDFGRKVTRKTKKSPRVRPASNADFAYDMDEVFSSGEEEQAQAVRPKGRPRKKAKPTYKSTKNVMPTPTILDAGAPAAIRKGLSSITAAAELRSLRADENICLTMEGLKERITAFAKSFPAVPTNHKHEVVKQLLLQENAHLVRYIGCLAQGGNNGPNSWRTLLGDTTCRHAIVVGIVGRALKEHVFGKLYFGARAEFLEELHELESQRIHQDGFSRTRERATKIAAYTAQNESDVSFGADDREEFHLAATYVALQLEQMLLPFWKQGSTMAGWKNSGKRQELINIVSGAGQLNRDMRSDSRVVYYWPPTFKDEEFEPGRMECFNLKAMIQGSPYDKKTVNGMDRAILRPGREEESEAVVRVVCFPGLVAYRQHGGELAQRELGVEDERRRPEKVLPPDVLAQRKRLASSNRNELTGSEGFRTRVLCKSTVLLQWGKQRLLTKEAGTSRHLDAMKDKSGKGMAKYDDDYFGFYELWNIYGDHVWGEKTFDQQEREFEESKEAREREKRRERRVSPGGRFLGSFGSFWRSGSASAADGDA